MHLNQIVARHLRTIAGQRAAIVAAVALVSPSAAAATEVITPVGVFDPAPVLAASGATTALAVRGGSGRQLYVGTGGLAPTLAVGAGSLPGWARPQVGTDASGRMVVVYPRCSTATVDSCDLYSYDVTSHAEAPIAGVNHAGIGEVDGAMDRGAVAFNRWSASAQPGAMLSMERTKLFYKPAGGKARLLTTKGGRDLDLRGSWIVQLRDTRGEGPDSGSYTVSVELVSTSGKRRTVRRSFVGEAGQVPTSPTVFKGRVVWGVSWNDRPAQVWRYDISTRQLTMAWLSDELYMFAPTSPTAGFGMRYTAAYQEDERGELVRIENIPPGAKRQR